jgi:glucokinase
MPKQNPAAPRTNLKRDSFIGIDLGGTKILAGMFDQRIECIGRAKLKTKGYRGPKAVIERILRCVDELVQATEIPLTRVKALGLGAPGAVDPATGTVLFAPNLPNWKKIPLGQELEDKLQIPVRIENDGNVCALGVHALEFGGTPRNLIGIFIGTGIGAGIIIEGKLYSGFNKTAGEVGHMVVQVGGPKCGCGNRGCLEAIAGRQAIYRRIQAMIEEGNKSALTEIAGEDFETIRSGDLRKAIKRGDKITRTVLEDAAYYIGIGVANLMNLLNPEKIVLGGGVIDALKDLMLPTIIETAHLHALAGTDKGIQISATKLGDDAGISGAAVLARGA